MEFKKETLMNRATGVNNTRSTLIQVLMCFISNTSVISSGMTLGFTAVVLPYMIVPNDVLYVTMSQGSWIASLASISTPVGCIIMGPIIDYFGRKSGILLVNIPAFIGWLLITIQPTLIQLYIGRLLTGFACGLSSIPSTVYISEASTASLRGLLVAGTSIAISFGVAVVYILGLYFKENWKMTAAICSLTPVLSALVIGFFLPESPLWLITHGKPEKASKALMQLRGTKNAADIQLELDEMTERIKNNKNKSSPTNIIQALARPESYKPLIVMNTFFLFQQISGTFVVIFYAVDIVREAGVTTNPFVVAVSIGVTRLVFTVVAAWMSRKFGRRVTALISGLGMTISLMILATLMLIQLPQLEKGGSNETMSVNETIKSNISNNADSNSSADQRPPDFLPILTILIYILSSTVGFLTLPWSMIGEVYPAQVRGVASGFTTCMAYLFSFIMLKLYPAMLDYMQRHGLFYFYGSMALLGTVFVFFFLPETQGKTLAEIEGIYAKRRRRRPEVEDEEVLSSTRMITIVSSNNK